MHDYNEVASVDHKNFFFRCCINLLTLIKFFLHIAYEAYTVHPQLVAIIQFDGKSSVKSIMLMETKYIS